METTKSLQAGERTHTKTAYATAWEAAERLLRSERGERALRGLNAYLDMHGFSLDDGNQRAIVAIVQTWFRNPHDTRDALESAVNGEEPPPVEEPHCEDPDNLFPRSEDGPECGQYGRPHGSPYATCAA